MQLKAFLHNILLAPLISFSFNYLPVVSVSYALRLGCQVILGNTYHLAHRPGSNIVNEFCGLPAFMNLNCGALTDSGGFQMVSLMDLADVSVGLNNNFTFKKKNSYLTVCSH